METRLNRPYPLTLGVLFCKKNSEIHVSLDFDVVFFQNKTHQMYVLNLFFYFYL